jgi:formylglycine-generating enzyme required for sulfatase activity
MRALLALALLLPLAAIARADDLDRLCAAVAPEDGMCEISQNQRAQGLSRLYSRFFGSDPFDRSVAVVIGIGDYRAPYEPLEGRADDAMRMRDFLLDEADFDLVVVLTDGAASRARVERLLTEILPARIGPKDRFLFHYSGHGETRRLHPDRKRGYLVTSAATGTDNWSNMISMESIQAWSFDLARARHSLWVIDACFSGLAGAQTMSAVEETTRGRLAQRAHHILTAGLEDEQSLIVHGRSLFTNAFIEAARRADVAFDRAPDGLVSLHEMRLYIQQVIDAEIARLNDRRIGRTFKMSPRVAALHDDDGAFFFLSPETRRESGWVAAATSPADSSAVSPMGQPPVLAPPAIDAASVATGAGPTGTATADPHPTGYAALEPQLPASPPDPAGQGGTSFSDCDGCPRMVVLPPGAFEMGSEFGPEIEKPKRSLTLASPFAIGKTEVTLADWRACVAAGACPNKHGDPDLPVTGAAWDEVQAYLAWLTATTGERYRLPSETEWEYAARGGTGLGYPTGSVPVPGSANFGEQHSGPKPVASYPASPFGLHDLAGNVWEWVADCAGPYSGSARPGGASGAQCNGVLRGGSWRSSSGELRSTNRYFYPRTGAREDFGFRVARDVPS